MTANQFNYLATLSIYNGTMSIGDMLRFLNRETMSDEEQKAAKKDMAVLIGTGLVRIEMNGDDWRATQLSLTDTGAKVIDIAASARVEQMIYDWRVVAHNGIPQNTAE